jgi:hypothetical protein
MIAQGSRPTHASTSNANLPRKVGKGEIKLLESFRDKLKKYNLLYFKSKWSVYCFK